MSSRRFEFLDHRLQQLEAAGLRRQLLPRDPWNNPELVLCSNDYLGLSQDPRVIEGACAALNRWGAGAGAARLVSGELECYPTLEEELAEFFGFEAVLLFSSGYHANVGLMSCLTGPTGRIYSDALNHASLIDGCRLSRATVQVFPHQRLDILEPLLTVPHAGPSVVVTEGMFSMDGDVADVDALRALADRTDAVLVIDDAHAIGALGPEGRGTAWGERPGGGADILVGTFGKAFGCAGAFVAGPRALRDVLLNQARSFVFTTGPSPAMVGAVQAVLDILRTDPGPQARLADNVAFFRAGLQALGFDCGPSVGHIIPLIVGEPALAVQLAEAVRQQGVLVRAIRPPTVPVGTSRLRLTLSASHTRPQLELALEVLGREARSLRLIP